MFIAWKGKILSSMQTEVRSKQFDITRGSKQGDPISPTLFHCLLQHLMQPMLQKWNVKNKGIPVEGADTNMTNLRFANDVILIGSSLNEVKSML